MKSTSPVSILLLCDFDPFGAQMVQDSIHGIVRQSSHKVSCISFRGNLPASLDLGAFDAVVMHYSSFIHNDRYVSPLARCRLAGFDGFKAVILHDEYQHVNRTKAVLSEIGIKGLFTCFEKEEARKVYGDLVAVGLDLISVLPGYVGPSLLHLDPGPLASTRRVDIGYRGRRYPFWHGELGQERVRIHERVLTDAPKFGLRVNSSVRERDRLAGAAWLRFQRLCKAVLGTESGASVVDFTGAITRKVEAHQITHPTVSFEELKRLYFAQIEDKITLRTLSPRIFEAIACGCALILYEGSYAGRLKPGVHYAPLRKDHGNFHEIAALLRDGSRLDRMVATARDEVLLAPQNQESTFIAQFDSLIGAAVGERRSRGYEREEFETRFGRYDGLLTRPVIKRQIFRAAHRAYCSAAAPLPNSVERRLTARLRTTWHRLSRFKGES
jgi:hypothetical protein